MEKLHAELTELVRRAKLARNTFPSLTAPDTLPAINMAEELSRIGGDFIKLSVMMKRAARQEADKRAKSRCLWSAPKMNAERAASAMQRAGAYSVMP
jgi:hypothetical protein